MRKVLGLVLCFGLAVALGQARFAEAGVVIKVRALNPLETQESVAIHYPLPKEITQDDILQRKITYSLDHSEDEEPPKSEFKVSYNEEEGAYFIDDEVTLLPREVVTLEVHVKDVWVIAAQRVEALRQEVEALFEGWKPQEASAPEGGLLSGGRDGAESHEEGGEEPQPQGENGAEPQAQAEDGEDGAEAQGGDAETKETALMMKGEILNALDKIIARQEANSILKVGVEQHMTAYNDNIKDLLQVREDIALLTELMQYGPEEGEEEAVEEDEEALSATEDGKEQREPEAIGLNESLPGDNSVMPPVGDE